MCVRESITWFPTQCECFKSSQKIRNATLVRFYQVVGEDATLVLSVDCA